jgi:hypothetical protein
MENRVLRRAQVSHIEPETGLRAASVVLLVDRRRLFPNPDLSRRRP